jgi:hypothetical protein
LKLNELYEKMEREGVTSNMRLTLKVETPDRTLFFYDIGAQAIEDPLKVLSEDIIIGVHDAGHSESIDKENKIWFKNYQDIMQPRWLEGFIKEYGVENVSIHEAGKYLKHLDTIGSIYATANAML